MNNEMFSELLESVKQADRIISGQDNPGRVFSYPDVEVRSIRAKTGLSQNQFASVIGVSKRTLENWEQGRRQPTGPAKALLKIVDVDPEHALKALHS